MIQQYFEQQNSMNGFPGAFPGGPNQSMNSFTSPTSSANPFANASAFRQQNGMSRFNVGDGDNFNEATNVPNPQHQTFSQNFVDPRMGGFDPRTQSNFDSGYKESFAGIPGMDNFGGNSSVVTGKPPRVSQDMTSMFGNPALAAYQRHRLNMFGSSTGRENVSY